MTYRYFDVHAHLHDVAFDADREAVLASMKEADICAITVGTDAASSRAAVLLAQEHEHIFASVGLHPHEALAQAFDPAVFSELIAQPKVVALGECGLDYFFSDGTPKERQRAVFSAQVAFAQVHHKPLMLHGRPSKGTMDAYEDMLSVLASVYGRESGAPPGMVHFFVGTPEIAERFFKLGFRISFSGIITFTHEHDALLREVPLEKVLIETDSPYATPIPKRGKRNDPRYVPLTVAHFAQIRGEREEDVSRALLSNVRDLFGIL
jgi:TatD DNase family protein